MTRAPVISVATLVIAMLAVGLALSDRGEVFPGPFTSGGATPPQLSFDMQPSGTTYDDSTNTMTVGAIENCLTSSSANHSTHNHVAHLVIQDVEDLVGWQARLNYDGGKMRPLTANFAPFTDSTTGQNVSFVNLPIDSVAGVHRDVTSASDIPPAASGPQTALLGSTYQRERNSSISPDTPGKQPPDDSSYGAPSGGVVAALTLQVVGDQRGQSPLTVDLDDGSPNAPGSNIEVFTGTGTTSADLSDSALGDGFHGEGTSCAAASPTPLLPPLPTIPPLPTPPETGSGGVSVTGPTQFLVSDLPSVSKSSEQPPRPLGLLSPSGVEDASPPTSNSLDATFSASAESMTPPAVSAARFDGLHDGDNWSIAGSTGVVPADAQMAVGQKHVFEMVNIVGRINTRPGTPVQSFPLSTFFGVPAGSFGFDPKVMFDSLSARWFASLVSARDNPDPTADEGRLHLAISQTNDPTGLWNRYSIDFVDRFPDYAGIGLTSDKLTVSYNLFSVEGPPDVFFGEQTLVFQKSDLMSGAPAPTACGPGPSLGMCAFPVRNTRFTVRPAQSLTAVNDQYLAARNESSSTLLTVIRVTGTPDGGSVTEAAVTDLAILPQNAPPNAPAGFADIDTGDRRILDAMWRNGSLWVSASAACVPPGDSTVRSCLHLIEVNAPPSSLPSLRQDILFGAVADYYSWPAVRTDVNHNLYVSFTRSNATTLPEARAAGRLVSEPPNQMTGSVLLRAGEIGYSDFRWGDYLGAAVDPVFSRCVWVVGEYAKDQRITSNQWGTYIAGLSYSGGCDGDNDGWSDSAESIIGTDPADACRDNPSDNAWPADINNDGFSDIFDIAKLTNDFGRSVPPAPARHNIAPDPPDGFVDIGDISRMTGLFGQGCS